MENIENIFALETQNSKSLKDYLRLIRKNLLLFILIIAVILSGTVLYTIIAIDIYSAKTLVKINKSGGDILQSPLIQEFEDYGSDRFIANEIAVLKSYKLRKRVAESLTDTFNQKCISSKKNNCRSLFYNILQKESIGNYTTLNIQPVQQIAAILPDVVNIEQEIGVDIIVIEVESPSSYECALIANMYADSYKILNLEFNRNQLTFVKEFLKNQKDQKQLELRQWEDTLKVFQEKGGIIALDEQATALIGELSSFEAQKNAAQIELMASDEVLSQYKSELIKQDPALADYLESLSSEAYITALQQQLAELQLNKDLAVSNHNSKMDLTNRVKEYDNKIFDLKAKLNEKIKIIKAGIFASSPSQVKELSQKIIEEEVKNRSLRISVGGLQSVVSNYERRFNKLPKSSLELAQFQRGRESLEKLYILVEEKYQEALINEQSQPGNVIIIDEAERPILPSKPNRILIIIIGLMVGSFASFIFLIIRDYFDTRVKTPEDIEKEKINVLGWVSHSKSYSKNGINGKEIFNLNDDTMQSESFRTLRTRILFSKTDPDSLKIILTTSSAPQEGKTYVSVNLARAFTQLNKKTIILDCDLRKPRIHSLFQVSKSPGLVDILLNKVSLDESIHKTDIINLEYITSGTNTPNPTEILASDEMKSLIQILRNKYDYIFIDSPPIIAITDSEILAKLADGTILIVNSDSTEIEMMQKAVELLKRDKVFFVGTVLNNFTYKKGYGPYHKYYNYKTDSANGSAKSKTKKKKHGV